MESAREVFEGAELTELRRDSSFVETVGTDPGEDPTGRSCGAEEILKEESMARIRRIDSRSLADRQILRSCEGFNP